MQSQSVFFISASAEEEEEGTFKKVLLRSHGQRGESTEKAIDKIAPLIPFRIWSNQFRCSKIFFYDPPKDRFQINPCRGGGII